MEGLTAAEKEAFVYAFGKVRAVQCGFCIPGMVMSGKALLDTTPDPAEEQIKKAIRGNVCRCTGYKKIIEGISLAGAILRGDAEIDPDLEEGGVFGVGDRAFRGFGVCQSEFALESTINLLAEQVGISPWKIRCRNAIEPGKVLPNGQIADCSTALKETLLAVKDAFEQNPGRAGIAAQKAAGNLGPAAHQMMKLLSEQPAKLFGMYPRKGALSVGSDADIVILSEILALAEEYGYLPIPNPGAEEGQSVSLRLGLSQLLDMDGVHLVEADDPKELQDVDTQVGQVVLEVGAVSVQGVQYHVGGTVSDLAAGHINGVLRARAGVHLLR